MEDNIKNKDPKKGLFKGISCSECRVYEHPVSKIFQTMIDCTKFHEWWPKSFTSSVEVCTPEKIGSTINFTSDWGNYSATISEVKENEQMSIQYDKGIMNGSQIWQLKELESMIDESGNTIPKTQVCYDAKIIPTTKKLQLFTSFLSETSKRGYFSPLLDALESRMVQQAVEEKRIREEQLLQQQIQEQEQTILQEEDVQIEELKNIQLQLNQVQTQIQQYIARLQAQKAIRERQQLVHPQQPVVVGTPAPLLQAPLPSLPQTPAPLPQAPLPALPQTPHPALQQISATSLPETPVSLPITPAPSLPETPVPFLDQVSTPALPQTPPPPLPQVSAPLDQTPATTEIPEPISSIPSSIPPTTSPTPHVPSETPTPLLSPLSSVFNPPPIVVAVANSTKSSMDEPFSQVTLQEPRSIDRRQIKIISIDEPIIVVPVNKSDSDSSS